jgi:aminoglycoside phosphotransferase family enzyme
MEHICFTQDLSIIDCIEFNDRFRYSDTVADIAFLLMDLEYHGGEKFSKILWDTYKEYSGETDVESLLTFYKVYRAFVRGKVNGFQVDDESISTEKKDEAVQTAGRYFQLAHSYIN